MYKLIEKLDGVSGFKSFEDKLYYTVDGALNVEGKSILADVEGYSFWFIDGGLFYHTEDGEERYMKADVDHLIDIPWFVETESKGLILGKNNFRRENRKWKWELVLIDLETMRVMKELPLQNYRVLATRSGIAIGCFEQNKISALNIFEGELIWEIDIAKLGGIELDKFLGLYKDQILLACKNHLLLSVDLNTGEIIYKWRELPGFEVGTLFKDVLPNPTNFVLDKRAAKLIGVFDTYYFEIDLETNEITYHQLEDELAKHGVSDFRPFYGNPFTDEHLFLTAHSYLEEFPRVDLSSVLALNRKTKKVDWIHVFRESGTGTNIPRITDSHLYQIDHEGTLYVFEKEGNSL